MSGNWLHNIRHVTPGEPVDAGVVNRPDRTLEDRTDYLKDRLDASDAGRALFDVDATIASDVLPGQPVFWNHVAQRYERALVATEVDTVTQAIVVLPSSECVGMCLRKKAADRGDIVLRGLVTFENLNASVGQTVAPGRYFLSASEPGKLTKQQPPVTVSVCYVQGPRDNCSDALRVIVMPQLRDYTNDHTHYRFDLIAAPAGTGQAVVNNKVTVVSPSAALPGWLPANNAVFNGKAPAGAVFGYNISKHPAVSRVWPPVPIQSVSMLWDKGSATAGGTEIPLGAAGLAICDVNGIWWMSDCPTDVPWPASPAVVGAGINNTTEVLANRAECPRTEAMRVTVIFLRMLLGNDRTVVTSLAPAPESPIEVLNCDGEPGNTGDLELDLNLQVVDCAPLGVDANGKVLGDVIEKNKLQKIWVAEGVIAHNLTQLSLTSTRTRPLTNAEKTAFDFSAGENVLAHQGLIRINFDNQFAEREVAPQIVRLNDAVERLYKDIPYLGLPGAQESSLRLRFNIPYVSLSAPASLQMKIRVQLFGRGGALTGNTTALPALTLTYRKINVPGTGATPLPASDTTLAFPSNAQSILVLRDQVVQRDSGLFTVAPGDTVLVTIQRAYNVSDTYPEVGILRVSGIIIDAGS